MHTEKAHFIEVQLLPLFATLTGNETGKWGKMNAHQTVEHIAQFFAVSNGSKIMELVTPAEQLPRFIDFLRSEKPFKENTSAPMLPEEPMPTEWPTYAAALNALDQQIQAFFKLFTTNTEITTVHPVFGALDFKDWILLHYKHVTHHARQFSLL
ncbi:MAG: DUF1569 domain-containing protein [Ferruginibacter sp.]